MLLASVSVLKYSKISSVVTPVVIVWEDRHSLPDRNPEILATVVEGRRRPSPICSLQVRALRFPEADVSGERVKICGGKNT